MYLSGTDVVSWCPLGGAVCHRAADLQSTEETGRHGDTQKTRGNRCDLNMAELTLGTHNVIYL